MTASRDASVVTVLGESVMNDMTDTTDGSRVCGAVMTVAAVVCLTRVGAFTRSG